MTSKCVAQTLADLGIARSLSRPHVSDDNPYSESAFKTLKGRPGLPERFDSVEHGRKIFDPIFNWYNHEHHHSGIAMLTPFQVHHGIHQTILDNRAETMRTAFLQHPERFVNGCPRPQRLPEEVWINKPNVKQQKAPEVSLTTTPQLSHSY